MRLQSAEIHVGESETLPTQEQARLLGEAWERASGPKPLGVRLVIHHPTGTTASYQLGAHAPAFDAGDLDLIHKLWLDVVSAVGPHVHHRDVVRAALKHMDNELKGPDREAALGLVRETARPGDELAAIVRARDFTRMRDLVRNWPPGDLAAALIDLPLDEQVVVFRILPRKDAAGTFEYLSIEQQEALLKAMAQEDVAALLNDMAPDERTRFLEELPASATQAVAGAAHAAGTRRRGDAAGLSRRVDRPADDAALRQRQGGVDRSSGAGSRPETRARQRDAQCHLRRRRPRAAD